MKRIFALAFFLFYPIVASAQIAINAAGAAHSCVGSTNGNNVSNVGISTVGASLVGIVVSSANAVASITPTTTGSDTVTCLTEVIDNTSTVRHKICYVKNPTSSASYQVSLSQASSFPAVCAVAFTGTDTTTPNDGTFTSGNNTAGTAALNIGSITPVNANSLILDGLTNTITGAHPTIGSSQTYLDFAAGTANSYAIAVAYEVQSGGPTARSNITWTMNTNDLAAGSATSFKPAVAAGPPVGSMLTLGVGR